MSDTQGSGFFDHLDVAEETVEEKEVANPETLEGEDPKDGEPEGGEEEEEEHKPWKAIEKSSTPIWARKRFKEYSTTINELKQYNQQLMSTVKEVLNRNQPSETTLTRKDFPDEESFIDYRAEMKARALLEENNKNVSARSTQEAEVQRLQQAEETNTQNALADLPDYHEAVANGDPDITLPNNVVSHLSISPAGPYVKYRIATDDALADSLKRATPQQKIGIIQDLHDKVLDVLIKRQSTSQADTPAAGQKQAVRTEPQVSNVQTQRRVPPKAPSKQKSSSKVDILSLSGDDYVRARNEQLYG